MSTPVCEEFNGRERRRVYCESEIDYDIELDPNCPPHTYGLADLSTDTPPCPPTMSLHQVSEKLDVLLIRHLELIQEYVDLSLKAEVYQREGYLNLAKIRFIEGPHSMSRMRLPTQDSEEYDAVIKVMQDNSTKITVRSLWQEPNSSENVNKLLRQFGILSPPSVKTAQANFRENLALSIDRVNVMQELNEVQAQFRELQHVKNLLVKHNLVPEP